MSDPLALARPELRRLRAYTPGAYEPGLIRLNANESPWRMPTDKSERGLNVYPPPRPDALRARLAALYGVDDDRILVTRGSSEAIDLLIRGFCRSGIDSIVVLPPTFDMYRVYATIQGANIIEVPLRPEENYSIDLQALRSKIDESVKIVFVCSPNNPTGTSLARSHVEALCLELQDRALVVIDEAYHEFADAENYLDLLARFDNVVLLRTLSKFVSLAGVRCGSLIADRRVIEYLAAILPPYTFPTPSIELVLDMLTDESLQVAKERVSLIKLERHRLSEALRNSTLVERVYPSDANFIFIRSRDAEVLSRRAHRAGILVRRFPGQPGLEKNVRITIGRPPDNDRLIRALAGMETEGE